MTTRTMPLEQVKAKIARMLGKNRVATGRTSMKREPDPKTGIIEMSRAVMTILADDCTAFAEGAARHTQRVFDEALKKNVMGRLWLPSFVALGTTDVALSSSALARSTRGLGIVGAVGGVGLMVASTLDLWRAQSAEEVLDATGDLTWGVQGLSYVTVAPTAAQLTAGLGFVGAVVQMSAGMLRIKRGLQVRDTRSVKLGTLDVGGGILWAALDVASWGNPIVLGSYVVLMVGREAYAHKDTLLKSWFASPPLLQPARI